MKIHVEASVNDGQGMMLFLRKELITLSPFFNHFLDAMFCENYRWPDVIQRDPRAKKGYLEFGCLGLKEVHWIEFLHHGNMVLAPNLKVYPNYIKIKKV